MLWTGFIVCFFLIQAVIWMVAISITHRDHSHAVVSGYDEQALNWDEIKKQQKASQALGWSSQLSVENKSDTIGQRKLNLILLDRHGLPVTSADVEIQAFHRGRAAIVQKVDIVETAPGKYVTRLQIRNPGKWRFSGKAKVGDRLYLFDETLRIRPLPANRPSNPKVGT